VALTALRPETRPEMAVPKEMAVSTFWRTAAPVRAMSACSARIQAVSQGAELFRHNGGAKFFDFQVALLAGGLRQPAMKSALDSSGSCSQPERSERRSRRAQFCATQRARSCSRRVVGFGFSLPREARQS